jgi:hypothetical protein
MSPCLLTFSRQLLRAVAASLILMVMGCQHVELKKQIADLDLKIADRRTHLSEIATPYRAVGGADAQIDASSRPIIDVFKAIDAESTAGRVIRVQSIERQGRIAEVWTKCWPFSSKAGLYIRLWRDDSLQGAFYLSKTHPNWTSRGLEFDFDLNGVAVALIAGGVEYCFGSSDIGVIPISAGIGSQPTKGRLGIIPSTNDIEYQITLDRPPYYVVGLCVPGFCVGWPFKMDKVLTDGKIHNVIGSSGQISLAKTGAVRKFDLKATFVDAAFLDHGLRVSGPLTVDWSTPEGTAGEPKR